jgi:uncharacterized protein GlcG (DUF336 family)
MPDIVRTQTHVTLGAAQAAIEAGIAKARDLGVNIGIVVVDANGRMVASARMDGASDRADEGARGKAAMAAGLGVPTAEFIEKRLVHNEPLWRAMAARTDIFPVQGGYPLKYKGQKVGGVGCSGAKHEEDSQCAEAAANHFAAAAERDG